jgi:putative ABC transport system substrate-binding protein
MAIGIGRRQFISAIGGAAVAWPLAARAQQPRQMRRIGVLLNLSSDDPQAQKGVAAFLEALQSMGWTDGRNAQIDIRWGSNDLDDQRKYATELVALAPEIILASGTASVTAIQHVTRALPIVFVRVADPVAAGFVDTLARPGRNVTGFMLFEYSLGGKWLELLRQIAPGVARAAVIRDPANPSGLGEFSAIQSVASSFGVELRSVDVRDASEIEGALAAFSRAPNGGVIVASSATSSTRGDLIVKLVERYKLPAVYADRLNGSLISYGPDRINPFRLAAGYVDRILKGERPADLPVQAPTKYELVINLKTAKAIGLTIPSSLLATADEVIE